ncbi:MAG: HupE/UreJ family protein [Opitutales bacterium]|nr:HupE/UreJ family protein [Opitutales bacterium]MDG1326311.1 HupE/UreJ family protein [Opitutales bacterium]
MRFWNIILSLTFFSSLLNGHPIPDIPVIGSFDQNGSSVITVEIDTRSFADDPEEVPMLEWEAFNKLTEEEKENLLLRGKNMIQDTLLIRFNEKKWVLPSFDYNFEKKIGGNSVEETDTFVIRGYAHRKLDSDINSYQIRAKESAEYDVIFTNRLNGIAQKRVNVLFPGEDSFILDLTNLFQAEEKNEISEPANFENKDSGGSQSTFFSFLRQGFVHVVPLGLDHILFVFGIFLLSRKWKPLILQVSAFTLAHTLTLALATLGIISVSSKIVEPIIAASIAIIAIENIIFPGYKPYRLVVVFIFGLIHGLGFAGALSGFDLEPSSLLVGLFGFNLGVEFGQLSLLFAAYMFTAQIKNKENYRQWIVLPGSIIIALFGVYWTIERIFF